MQDLEFNLKVVQMAQASRTAPPTPDEQHLERKFFSQRLRSSEADSVWQEPPHMHFPQCLFEAINLAAFQLELEQLIAYLKQVSLKKKSAETKQRREA